MTSPLRVERAQQSPPQRMPEADGRGAPRPGRRRRLAATAAFWIVWTGLVATGCAHSSATEGGGPMFAVSIESIDGNRVATTGHMSQLSYLVQVADRLVRVWPIRPRGGEPLEPTTLLEADASALKSGILIESGWSLAIVHEVTDDELASGAALVYVPGERRSAVVELRFRRVGPGGVGPSAAPSALDPDTDS